MTAATKSKLPDGRQMRALADGRKNTFNQIEIFGVGRLLLPSESIMTVKEHDQSIQSGAYKEVNPNNWWRCNEYGFYQKDPKAPLGREIIWIEDGVTYKKLVPDVPVKVDGKEISLQKAFVEGGVTMGVYASIDLLKIEQKDTNLFEVSVVDENKVIGRVRVVDFMRNILVMRDNWGLTVETLADGTKRDFGIPLASLPSSSHNPDARYSVVKTDFNENATGYHGSLVRGVLVNYLKKGVVVGVPWSEASGVAVVGHDVSVAAGSAVPIVQSV